MERIADYCEEEIGAWRGCWCWKSLQHHWIHVPLKIILSITPHGGAYNQWCRKSLLSPCPVPVVTTPTFADIWLDGIVCIWMIYTAILALNMWGPAWTSSDIAWLHRYTQLENITPISSGQFHLDNTSNPLDQINWVVIYQTVFGWYLRWLEPICSNNFLETSQSAILGWCTIYSQLCTIYYNNALLNSITPTRKLYEMVKLQCQCASMWSKGAPTNVTVERESWLRRAGQLHHRCCLQAS